MDLNDDHVDLQLAEVICRIHNLPEALSFILYLDGLVDYGPDPEKCLALIDGEPQTHLSSSVGNDDRAVFADFLHKLESCGEPFAFLFRWPDESRQTLLINGMSVERAIESMSTQFTWELAKHGRIRTADMR